MIRVLIVDDHEIMRLGLRSVLEVEEDFEVVGEACDGEDAVKKAIKNRPDVVLLDIKMPKKDGIQAGVDIKQDLPDVKTIALTAIDNMDEILTAIRSGADGYILKNISYQELIDGVRQVAGGQMYLHPLIGRQVMARLKEERSKDGRRSAAGKSLTKREFTVLTLIAEGLTNKEIAGRLYLSEETAKTHVSNILIKLDQPDRMQAVLAAIRDEIIPLPKAKN